MNFWEIICDFGTSEFDHFYQLGEYGGCYCVCVYTTREDARTALKEIKKDCPTSYRFKIRKVIVDEPVFS